MFDFYPINIWCTDSTNINNIANQFNILRELCSSANKYKPDNYFYVAQAHGYSKSNISWAFLRQPTPNEFRAGALLSLAHGAKGLIFYCYYSSSTYDTENQVTEIMKGLLNLDGTRSQLWNESNKMNTRLHGSFGDTLLTLSLS